MKHVKTIKLIALVATLTFLTVAGTGSRVMAQAPASTDPVVTASPTPVPTVTPVTAPTDTATKNRPRTTTNKATQKPGEVVTPTDDKTSVKPTDIPTETQANRVEQGSEDASSVVAYYNNFFTTYRLGPEDVISVTVFGQDRYSRSGITIPPSGRISLALVPGGLFVNGKTVDEVAELIKKRYDEYIIDPEVTVSLDKAASYRYSIVGDVAQPGIRLMNRRMTVTEAIAEAGGVLGTGDRSKVVVLRRQPDNTLAPIPVNVSAIYKGKAPDSTYLIPGDQIFVPGNRMKKVDGFLKLFQMVSFARIFTGL